MAAEALRLTYRYDDGSSQSSVIVRNFHGDTPQLRTLDACVARVREVVARLVPGQQVALHFVFSNDGKEEHTSATVTLDTTYNKSNSDLKPIPPHHIQVFRVDGQFRAGELAEEIEDNDTSSRFGFYDGFEGRVLELSALIPGCGVWVCHITTPSPLEAHAFRYNHRTDDGRPSFTPFERTIGAIVQNRFTSLERTEKEKSHFKETMIIYGLGVLTLAIFAGYFAFTTKAPQ